METAQVLVKEKITAFNAQQVPFTPQSWLTHFLESPEKLVLGMISGTSMDGVDLAIIRSKENGALFEFVELHSFVYPAEILALLHSVATLSTAKVSELHTKLGIFFGEAANTVIKSNSIKKDAELLLIGSHGQTVYHHSCVPNAISSTLQIGDGDHIAAITGLPVISDFRTKDIALGGQGAPLTPYGDWVLFKQLRGKAAVLNLGGVANLTFLAARKEDIIGFDTGPGNAPLDRLARKLSGNILLYDDGGRLAAKGVLDELFVERLLQEDSFLVSVPPKSTGFEMYGDKYIESIITKFGRLDNDLLLSMTCYVARTIAQSIEKFQPFSISELVVAGGGALNATLMSYLRKYLPHVTVTISDAYGVPIKAREAICFAVMAHDAVYGKETSLPAVTGASRGALLGKWSFA
jgi:anhydro-N-acetylmuramic acid kinase